MLPQLCNCFVQSAKQYRDDTSWKYMFTSVFKCGPSDMTNELRGSETWGG